MRIGKMIALALTVLLVSNTLSACNLLRTPYERQKIAENGGVAKKESDKGSDAGGGGKGEGGKGATGGQKDGKKKEDKEKVSAKRAETKGEQKERKKGQGVLYIAPKTLEDKNPKLSYEQKLSAAVSELAGVGGATVLLDDEHRAYVAISSDPYAKRQNDNTPTEQKDKYNPKYNVKVEGAIPQTLQERIAVKLRAIDGKIGRVHITNDPHHVDTLQRYAQKAAEAPADDMNTQALAEHIHDIWK